MKKLFIIIGTGAEFEEEFIKKVADELNHQSYHVEKIYNDDIRALKKTLALLEEDEIKNYNKYFVLYSGLNLRDLQDNLPCININASLYFRKLVDVAGGYETEVQKKLVFDLFMGGVAQTIKK